MNNSKDELKQALSNFKAETKSIVKDKNKPVTMQDMECFIKQTYYILAKFEEIIDDLL